MLPRFCDTAEEMVQEISNSSTQLQPFIIAVERNVRLPMPPQFNLNASRAVVNKSASIICAQASERIASWALVFLRFPGFSYEELQSTCTVITLVYMQVGHQVYYSSLMLNSGMESHTPASETQRTIVDCFPIVPTLDEFLKPLLLMEKQ